MLEFRTLGTIDLRRDAGERIEAVLAHEKRLALLVYLSTARPRGLHRRDTLVSLLWPELDDAHARGVLRHELYELRRALGPGVLIGGRGETVGVDGSALWCDASALDSALDGGRLDEALELWHGEFLPGFHVSGGEFERWLDDMRDRLARRVVAAGRELSTRAEQAADPAGALAWARRLIDAAPYDETGWQRLIVLLDRQGDRAGALVAYEDLAARLHTELEVEPSPETRALVERIRGRAHAFSGTVHDGAFMPIAPDRPEPPVAAGDVLRPGRLEQPVEPDQRPNPDISRELSQRRSRYLLPATLVVLVVLTAFVVRLESPFGGPDAPNRAVIEAPTVENQTGDPGLEPVRRLAADRLAEALLEADFVELIAPGDRGRVNALVSAIMYRRGDRLEVRTRLAEPGAGGRVLEMPAPVGLSLDDPNAGLDTVVALVLAAVATHYDPRFEAAATPHTVATRPPLWKAYLEYVQGSDLFGQKEYAAAAPRLLSAYQMDPRFDKTAVFGAVALAFAGRPAAADSAASALLAADNAPSDYARWFAKWLLADLHGRRGDAYRAAREFARAGAGASPSAIAVAGREALRMNRPREAVGYFRRVDVEHGWLRTSTELWELWTAAWHLAGDHRAELRVARTGRARFPESLTLIGTEVRARAALGDRKQVDALITEALTLTAGRTTPLQVAWIAAQELAAHGQPAAAAAIRRGAVESLAELDRPSAEEQLLHARLLLELGEKDAARRLLAGFSNGHDLEWLGLSGLVAAECGDEMAARDMLARLEGSRNPYLSGRHLLLAAGIRTALGEPRPAIETLRRAIASGVPFGVELHASPMLRPLADRRDFKELLRPRG